MNTQRKYGRTWHYPFSPGTTSDDRINTDYWQDLQTITQLVHTEKLDGENNCLNRYGVFARSHCIDSLEVRKKPGGHWIIRDLMGLDLVGLASL